MRGSETKDPWREREGDKLLVYFLLQVNSSMASDRTRASTVAAKEMPIAVHGSCPFATQYEVTHMTPNPGLNTS